MFFGPCISETAAESAVEGTVRDAFRRYCTCSRYPAAEHGAYAWCVARGSGNGMGKVHVKVIRSRWPVRVKFKPMHDGPSWVWGKNLGLNSWGEKPNRTPAEIKEYMWA